jgi:hypothetical protein
MYGAADGTHFNLPDARGRFPRAWAHGVTTDPDRATRTAPAVPGATISAGDHVGTNQPDELKSHRHTSNALDYTFRLYAQSSGENLPTNATGYVGYTGGNETRSINTTRMMIIKAY